MATAATSLLGLALPVTGELSGTWGDTVNVSITALLDSAVAGTTTLSSDADVTLTTTTLAANQARQAIILWTAGGTVTRTITAPAQSKSYIVINKTSSSQSIKIVGAGPTTGVTIVAGTAAFVVWNGVDFVTASVTSTTGILPVANGGTGLSSGTSGGVLAYTATGTLASSAALAASALVIGGGAGAAPSTTTTGTGVVTALGVNVGTAGAFVVNGGALGTPSSGTVTNLTGTASININGTVGATTANTGAFTTLTTSSTFTTNTGGLATYFRASGTAYTQIGDNQTLGAGTAFVIGSSTPYLAGVVAGSEAMRLTSTGLAVTGTLSATGVATFSAGTAALPAITTTGDTNTGIFFPAADTIAFSEGGAEAMRITSAGSVAIGTTTALSTLTVNGADGITMQRSTANAFAPVLDYIKSRGTTASPAGVSDGDGLFLLRVAPYQGSAYTYLNAMTIEVDGTYTSGQNPPTRQIFYTNAANGSAIARVTIDSSGNVGIGNTSPPTGVRVTSKAPSGAGFNYFLEQDNGLDGYLLACTSTAGALTFSRRDTSGTVTSERMRITSAGLTLVNGVTSAGASTYIQAFSTSGNGNDAYIGIFTGGSGATSANHDLGVQFGTTLNSIRTSYDGSGNARNDLVFTVNSADVGSFTSSGLSVSTATGVITLTSTTGTNAAYQSFVNTGGTYYSGVDNSTGASFSGVAYAMFRYAPSGRVIKDIIAGTGAITTISSTGLAVTGTLSATGVVSVTGGSSVYGTAAQFGVADGVSGAADSRFLFRPNLSTTIAGLRFVCNSATLVDIEAGTFTSGGTFSTAQTLRLSANGGATTIGGSLAGGTSGTGYSFSGSAPATSLTLGSSGNVGIGVTPSATAGQLQVTGAINNPTARFAGNANLMSVLNQSGLTLYTNLSGGFVDTTIVAGNTANTYMAFGIHNGTSYTQRLLIDNGGNVLVTSVAGLGYGTGSGGAVTQATSRTTGVTLNYANGAITLVSAAGLATFQSFTVTNSKVSATDVVHVTQKSGTDLYQIFVTATAAGSFRISYATTGGITTEQPVFNFAVIKAVTA